MLHVETPEGICPLSSLSELPTSIVPCCKEDAKKKHVWIGLRLLISQWFLLAIYHALLYEGIPLYLAQAHDPHISGLQHYIFSYFMMDLFYLHNFTIKALNLICWTLFTNISIILKLYQA